MPEIIPILTNNPRNVEYFPRPIRSCPENYAVIKFQRKFYYINRMNEVLIDLGPLEFTRAQVPIFNGDDETLRYKNDAVMDPVTENPNTNEQQFIDLLVRIGQQNSFYHNLDLISLERFALDGLDQAATIILNSDKNEEIINRVRNYRSRYSEIANTSDDDVLAIIQDFSLISQQVLDLPAKFIVEPYCTSAFSNKIRENLNRNFSVGDALTLIESPNANTPVFNYRTFKKNMLPSIFFYNIIFKESHKRLIEYDTLSYIFNEQDNMATIFHGLRVNLGEAAFERDFYHDVDVFEQIATSILNINNDILTVIEDWGRYDLERLFKLVQLLPRQLGMSGNIRVNIDSPDFPKSILKHSIFILSSISENRIIKRRCIQLHRLGIRNIGGLLAINPKYLRNYPNLKHLYNNLVI